MKYDLSVIIPARNEQFLSRTIEDLLSNIQGNTEIIVVLDGTWSNPGIKDHERLTIIYRSQSIGQRAACNEAVRLSEAKYVMKVDAHCAFDKGFDVKLMSEMQDDWTVVPVMRNLHAFNWVCKHCGMEVYQGPKPEHCLNETCTFEEQSFEQKTVWIPKADPQSSAYRFNKNLQFKYFPELRKSQPKSGLTETMSLQGSCFMVTRDKYWDLRLCDETWGSWGQQGSEVALKTWLSGGRVLCNHSTWYAHLFRTKKGFSFPYPMNGADQHKARQISQEIFLNDKWPKAKYPLSWLLDKFWSALKDVQDQEAKWTEEDIKKLGANIIQPCLDENINIIKIDKLPNNVLSVSENKPVIDEPLSVLSKGIIYYTDNRLDENISKMVKDQLLRIGLPIVSTSLQQTDLGKNIVVSGQRGYMTMFKQILTALENIDTNIVYFCEHDVLYHLSHFDFTPTKSDVYYYNLNVWKVRYEDGHAVKVDDCKQTSGLCGYRDLLISHYRRRIARLMRNQADCIERGESIHNEGFQRSMGFEPGTHAEPRGVDNYKAEGWNSLCPNLDIRHDKNLTPNRWSKGKFRNQKYTQGWLETDEITGWGKFREIIGIGG